MKKYTLTIIAAVVVGTAAFYAGMQYGKSSSGQNLSYNGQSSQSFRGISGGPNGRGQNNGGFLNGDVIAKDNNSITVKTRDGSSHVVFYSASTTVSKPSAASMNDVVVGSAAAIIGTQNSDGSFTAQSIQLRPASAIGQ